MNDKNYVWIYQGKVTRYFYTGGHEGDIQYIGMKMTDSLYSVTNSQDYLLTVF